MLNKEFILWIIIANLIAWPIAFFAVDKWLQDFAYRISIGIEAFIISALITICIALLTVSYQSMKAARSNPVDALKYE